MKAWSFTFYFLFFASVAFVMPFMVLYYQDLGFTGAQIGLLTGVTPLINILSIPFFTGLADRRNIHRSVMSLVLLVSLVLLAVFPFLRTFWPVFTLLVLFTIFIAPVGAFADSATMSQLAAEKAYYGRLRLGGTIGFGISAAVSGAVVQNYGLKIAFWGSAALLFFSLLVSQNFIFSPTNIGERIKGGAFGLLRNARWSLFLTLAFAGGLSFAPINIYFYPYLREIGAPESLMGLALTVGTLSEIPVLLFSDRLLRRFHAFGVLLLSVSFVVLRMLLLSATNSPGVALVLQLLNGVTIPLMIVAGVSYAAEHAPESLRSSAQGLFTMVFMGIGNGLGGFISGVLIGSYGGQGMYLFFGLVTLLLLILVAVINRGLPADLHSYAPRGTTE